MRWLRKLGLLLARGRFREELDEEMAFHRAEAERALLNEGIEPEGARMAARRQFGNTTRLREQSEEVVGFRVETIWQDVRYGLRQLRRSPGFGVTAVLILALGLGVSTAIFSFVDAALVQPLPFEKPSRIVDVDENSAVFPRSNLSRDDYEDWKRLNTTLSSLEVYTGDGFLLHLGATSEPVPALRVSAGLFRTLGLKPVLGRDFLPGEDQPGRAKVVLLSYRGWNKWFGGRSDVVGQALNLSGDSYTIVGVMPAAASYAPRAGNRDFIVPLQDKTGCEKRRSCHNLDGVGRLRDGVTVEQARGDLQRIAAQLEKLYPGSNKDQGASVQPLRNYLVGDVQPILLTLLAGAGLLLLIACVNVASLVLVRAESRRREVAVRGALGASRTRLARQFITEGMLLATVGCACGALVAEWAMKLLTQLVPKDAAAETMPYLQRVGWNAHTALFAAAMTFAAGLVLALTPMLRHRAQALADNLAEGSRGAAGRFWSRLGANLVVVELTIAVVLLAGAGLLGKSLYRLLHVETGFDPTHLATVQVMAPQTRFANPEQTAQLQRDVIRRLSALPGAVSVAVTTDLPIQCNCDTDWIRIVGKPFHGEHNEVLERDVSPEYFATLKARLDRGRLLTEEDTNVKPAPTVISESLARKYFPGEDPLGHKIGNGDLDPKSMREIVGVIADIRENGLADDTFPAEYEPIYQSSDNYFAVAMRTAGDEKALLPTMAKTIRAIDPELGVSGEITMMDQIESSQSSIIHRVATWLVGGFAAIALVLGVVGLYGVVAFSVSQRTREIGVRMALGAQRKRVYGMILRQAGGLTLIGIGAGLACSIAAAVAMKSLLFRVAAWDLPTLAAVALVLGGASLLASFLPARRAALVNPVEALRSE
ncbi:ABC transporter permease [Acidobacteria bacterium AB60]|nr:ABC transporter permease [Acidobacteria bacterium AB60]